MTLQRKAFVLVCVLLAASAVALGVTIAVSRRAPDLGSLGLLQGRLRDCPRTSNCVCSQDPRSDLEPLSYGGSLQDARQELASWLGSKSRVKILQASGTYVHAVFETPVLRFADDVEFLFEPAAEDAGGTIHVRSASRIGRSDLGTNRARVEDLRRQWAERGSGQ